MAYLWLGACVLLALAVWFLRRFLGGGPEVARVFFAATLAPVIGFVILYTFRYSFVADHYQYLACIGPFALVAAAINTTVTPLGRIKYFLLPMIYAALLVPLGWRTWRQGAIYANEETLWRATIAAYPDSWMAHHNLGSILAGRGELDKAIGYFEEALRLDPNQAEPHFSLANTFFRQGRMDAARPQYERALELNPRIVGARRSLCLTTLARRLRSG